MTAQDYLKALHELGMEHQQNVDALKRAWSIINKGKPLPVPINGHADALEAVRGWRQLADQAIMRMSTGKQFTIRDIQSSIESAGIEVDQSALSAFLKRQADDRVLTIVEAGRGRRATVYATN